MDAVRRDVDPIAEAERFVRSRTNAPKLIEILCEAENESVKCGDMARRLDISPQNLAKLLRDLEERDIVERHSAGRNVFVALGLVGQLLQERRNKDRSDDAFARPEDDFAFAGDSRIMEPLRNPKGAAFGQALASPAIN
jgi:DNA-binding MarR family transcriptional regulator